MAPRGLSDDERRNIARRVRALRESREMTQKALAARAGVGNHTMSAVEGGEGASLASLRDIAVALGATYDQLLGSPGGGDHHPGGDFEAGYRAGVADAMGAVRNLLNQDGT